MKTNTPTIQPHIRDIPPPVSEDVNKKKEKEEPSMILPNPWIRKTPPKFDIN